MSESIAELLSVQEEQLRGLDRKLAREHRKIVRTALEIQEEALRAEPLGSWGRDSRQRVVGLLTHGMRELGNASAAMLQGGARRKSRIAHAHSVEWFTAMDKARLGAAKPLEWNTLVWRERVAGTVATSRLRTHRQSFQRYGASVVLEVERLVAANIVVGASPNEIRDRVARATRRVTKDREWMVDRIIRTEMSHAYNGTQMETLRAENEEDGPVLKKLRNVYDVATAQDTYVIGEQSKPLGEPFFDAYHGREFMQPPNRPNDRATVVGWRPSWGSDALVERGRQRVEPEAPPPAPEGLEALFAAAKQSQLDTLAQVQVVGEGPAARMASIAVQQQQQAVARDLAALRTKPAPKPRPKRKPRPKASDKATAALHSEIADMRLDREKLLEATGDRLGAEAKVELEQLAKRQQAVAPKGTVRPGGQLVTDSTDSQKQRDAWIEAMTPEERQAVYDWSTEQWYREMRMVDSGRGAAGSIRTITGGHVKDAENVLESERKLTAFREALSKAPRYEGEMYRGLRELPSGSALRKALDTKGAVVELEAVSSWSTDQWAARSFSEDDDGGYLVVVQTKRGAVISDPRAVVVAGESEVMLDKGARFRVKSTKKRPGDMARRLVVLEEI